MSQIENLNSRLNKYNIIIFPYLSSVYSDKI